jgi:hypothetical protein
MVMPGHFIPFSPQGIPLPSPTGNTSVSEHSEHSHIEPATLERSHPAVLPVSPQDVSLPASSVSARNVSLPSSRISQTNVTS